MATTCPTCGTPAKADASRRARVMVRCATCGTQWMARPLPPAVAGAALPPRNLRALPPIEDISDAIVIDERPSPGSFTRPALPTPPRQPRRDPPRPLRSLAVTAVGAAGVFAVALIAAPMTATLMGLAPAAADAGNGLEFRDVASSTVAQANGATLVVEGEVVNTRTTAVALPRVRIALKARDGSDIASWLVTPAVAELSAGQTFNFRSARVAPPSAATSVTVNSPSEHPPRRSGGRCS